MERNNISTVRSINQKVGNLLWKEVCKVLSVGAVPTHIAFIMNGNRRYEQKLNLLKGTGHRAGLQAMLTMLMHCCELGNLDLLSEPVRNAAEELMVKTANYSKFVFTFCIAYTSTDEMVHAIQEACEERQREMRELRSKGGDYEAEKTVKIVDIEKHMYMAIVPDPDIVVRTTGENRLSNFLLWQTANIDLYSTPKLWPEMNF
ncbi:Di-trans-poly-cis-decaprenylcistransferase-like protein [Corchorus capsularis]|uniref:Di-trans-poly-cis-decaprenylcistransferase-like protein n=1 Tax=Corchorus capsularis TaxID=210143 RepID=A0A1R3K890_COCAP|nr:Di-trans-poly-cis-decaprenylcistransferase-like protein [Corchorus capsularis]